MTITTQTVTLELTEGTIMAIDRLLYDDKERRFRQYHTGTRGEVIKEAIREYYIKQYADEWM